MCSFYIINQYFQRRALRCTSSSAQLLFTKSLSPTFSDLEAPKVRIVFQEFLQGSGRASVCLILIFLWELEEIGVCQGELYHFGETADCKQCNIPLSWEPSSLGETETSAEQQRQEVSRL